VVVLLARPIKKLKSSTLLSRLTTYKATYEGTHEPGKLVMSMGTATALHRVIVVGKQSDVQELARPFTEQMFAADDVDDIWNIINSVMPDLIVFDYAISRQAIVQFFETAKSRSIDVPVIILGDENDYYWAKRFTEMGAHDYLLGLSDYNRLGKVIDLINHSNQKTDADRNDFFFEDCPSCISIVGRSEATKQTLKMINLVAKSSCDPLLIIGETGTGKELAARAIHILRYGTDAKFVAVNCAALTANLLESELFGHVKGAFTGADREKTGLLELAGNGVVFLDEISEMSINLQAKLLRVLQEKSFRKVGGIKDIRYNATIIASSNRNLHAEIDNNRFRRDLYYRLAICPITIAPLRSPNRKKDIPILAEYFLRTSDICAEKKGKIKRFTKLALEALLKHDWPGNVRELRNVIDRAVLLETTDKIGLSSLIINTDMSGQQPAGPPISGTKDFSLEKAERELIARALQETDWQKTRAAALLGITRATLYAKVKQYDIQAPSSDSRQTAPSGSQSPHQPAMSV